MTRINRSAADTKAKVSNTDLAGGFLEDKIVAGPGVTINKIVDGFGNETLVVTTAESEADQFGLHYLKCRHSNGCRINMEVYQIADHTVCYMRKVAC